MNDMLQRISDSERVIFGVPQGPDALPAKHGAVSNGTGSAFTPRTRGGEHGSKSPSAGMNGSSSGAGDGKEGDANEFLPKSDEGAEKVGGASNKPDGGMEELAKQLDRSEVVQLDDAQGTTGTGATSQMRVDLSSVGQHGGIDGATLDYPSGRESRGSTASLERPASAGSVLGRILALERTVKGLRTRL